LTLEIVPFEPAWIPAAGALLAERHRRDRQAWPALPARFEDPAAAETAVAAAWRRPRVSGVAAVADGRLLGYLLGEIVIAEIWGRTGWVRPAGCALAEGQSLEVIRELYAALGRHWVAFGCFKHFAVVPKADAGLVQTWFGLGFGIEVIHTLVDLDALDLTPASLPDGVAIRRAGPADREILADLSDLIWRELVEAPVWGIHLPEDESRAGWADLADDPTATVWLAMRDGEALGCQGLWEVEEGDDALLVPPRCLTVSVAATREVARRQGIGRALLRHGLREARAAGYRACLTDYRSANLAVARFLPGEGFPAVALRLARGIDPRIAWANWEDS
jgi:GNAT superfamily N-acetyltransferase